MAAESAQQGSPRGRAGGSPRARRRICVVTGGRADYGLLRELLRCLRSTDGVTLQLIATGMHLSPEFGATVRAIEEDRFALDRRIEMLLSSDSDVGAAKSLGLGVLGFADALGELRPDVLVVLGDRFEMLAAAQVAMLLRIPIAHIHGGEATHGVIDDAIRHAITKMAHLHFTANEVYRRRVVQLGERPDRVYTVGAPGLDTIRALELLSRERLEEEIGLRLEHPTLLVTYHPVTLERESPEPAVTRLLAALDAFPQATVVMTMPNCDTAGRAIARCLQAYAEARPERVRVHASLGALRYLSAIRHADVVVGNSSSGIIEAPFLGTPTVDVGTRQQGRVAADSVVHAADAEEAIVAAIQQALTPEFSALARRCPSLYGDGTASARIARILCEADLDGILLKGFFDLA
ncbi:MAG: UDP-N-acetylglucosamine 2-epimerase (hydrolyzing) [Candidatus Schekmanbacteria bacterium]|nr:UDP-N-acetylglucosamine 2-epimerase (hydrolyzing) [Candidatus Schekmanbacteria bacterium]